MEACATAVARPPPNRDSLQRSPRAGGPASCAPRRACRAASASPGPPPPPASRRSREQGRRPSRRPGCRAARPGRRTAASRCHATRRRPSGPPSASPLPYPLRPGSPARRRGPQLAVAAVPRGSNASRSAPPSPSAPGTASRSEGDVSKIGVVRVFSKPAPDAEDRLRRLFTLLLKHAARERQAAPEEDSLPESELAGDHIEAEA